MLCICIFLEISIITTFSLTVLKMGGRLRNKYHNHIFFNPIHDGGAKKAPPASFSSVTSTNVGIT